MKLRINGFENEIKFNDDSVNILTISDAKCFSHIIEVINNKLVGIESNEMFLLDESENELSMDKEVFLLLDVFNIDYSSKKILNKLYKIISDNINMRQDFELQSMSLDIRNYIIEEINELPFEFVMKSDLDVIDILKLYDLKIDDTAYNSVLERVEILINIISTLHIANILIIPNLKSFLSEEELLELYKYSLYNNVNLLLIERFYKHKLKYENILLIDENFDEIIL